LGRLETHVVPTEILKAVADLTETLRAHGRPRSTLAGEKTRRKRGEWLCFARHLYPLLLTDNAAAEPANGTRTGRGDARRCARRGEDGAAEILFEAVGNIFPQ